MSLAQDYHVIEALAAYTTEQTFTNGIGLGSRDRRVQQSDARPLYDMLKLNAILAIVIAYQESRPCAKWGRLTHLLSDPGIAW